MKRLNALFLAFILSLSLCSCSNETAQETVSKIAETASEQSQSTDIPPENAAETKEETAKTNDSPQPANELDVHFIDVGQADSALLVCGDETMLIDGGNVADSSVIVTYLKNLGLSHLNYMICTHAHEDHVGGLSGPLHTVSVDEVYAPEKESSSKAYTNFKKAALSQVSEIKHPKPGDKLSLGGTQITFFAPVKAYDDLNNTSIVLKAVFGKTSFLFTGDAERESEADMIDRGFDLKADVLKIGHHGSETSTSYVFLREIMPKYAVISVGKGNSYGHPTDAVLSRLRDVGATVYRTDLQGDIIAISDGENITFKTKKNETAQTNPTENEKVQNSEKKEAQQKEPAQAPSTGQYIGNKNTKKFHRSSCSALPKEENRVYFSERNEAVSGGYSPCKKCSP